MTKAEAARVVNATVRTESEKGRGQGVLVAGGFVLTAAHCMAWNGDGAMALGDHVAEAITTMSGANLRVRMLAADPLSDIAVLGSLDNQESYEEVEAFEGWCEDTTPVPIMLSVPGALRPFQSRQRNLSGKFLSPEPKTLAVRVRSHKGKWIEGKVFGGFAPPRSGRFSFEAADQIESGTSGGPILDSTGRLIGIVSVSGSNPRHGEKCMGFLPVACVALPSWVLLAIGRAQKAR
jgi:hypothetical protein